MKKLLFIWVGVLSFALVRSCEKENEDPQYPSGDLIASGSFDGVYWPTEGWRTCAPEEVGMNSSILKEMNEEILLLKELHVDVHGVLVVKDSYIVAEQYYSDKYGPDSLHRIHSCTKSLVSALYGIALEQENTIDLESKVIDYFQEYEIDNMTAEKAGITIEDMLTMSAGLEWYELEYPYADERNTYREWVSSDDRVKFVLDRPMVTVPGEDYSYNSGISHVLSAILQKVTGTRTDLLGKQQLFEPLGIDRYVWPVDMSGIAFGGGGVWLTPRDMAKFGYLYLQDGWWDGVQIVPQSWIEISQQPHIKRKYIPDYFYGYHWWVSDEHTYSAVGFGGQWITIVPEHNLVVVFTNAFADGNEFQWSAPERLLHLYILPAIR